MSERNLINHRINNIHFSRMSLDDIKIYTNWFEDKELALRMFKPDRKWIDYVTTGNQSAAWGAYLDGSLLAHIQTESYENGSCSIAIAIDPKKRQKGYSVTVLKSFLQRVLKEKGPILAFIEQDNYASIKTFKRAGFQQVSAQPNEDGILEFKWRALI